VTVNIPKYIGPVNPQVIKKLLLGTNMIKTSYGLTGLLCTKFNDNIIKMVSGSFKGSKIFHISDLVTIYLH
jgi:hypothetical protein